MQITLTLTLPEINEGLRQRIHTAMTDCLGQDNYRIIKQLAHLACVIEAYYDDGCGENLERALRYTKAALALNQIEYLLHKNGW